MYNENNPGYEESIHMYNSLPMTGVKVVCGPISIRLEVASGDRNKVLGVTRIRGFL
jgi:hypothetical protein